jgi:hypothetical protein
VESVFDELEEAAQVVPPPVGVALELDAAGGALAITYQLTRAFPALDMTAHHDQTYAS